LLKPGHKRLLLLAVALIGLVFAGQWLYHRITHVHIDDARIDGEVITISSLASGQIEELPVIEGDEVKSGQLLARIDSRDAVLRREMLVARLSTIEMQKEVVKAQGSQVDQETLGKYQSEEMRLQAVQADVASAQAQLSQASGDLRRAQELTDQKWLSPQALERVNTDYKRAEETHRKALADLAGARGTLSSAGGSRKQLDVVQRQLMVLMRQADETQAEIRRQDNDIAVRTILSPGNGAVVMTFVRRGEHVSAGQRILMYHDPANIWVQANVKETDVEHLRPGMPVELRVDAFPGKIFKGEIIRVGKAATTKFALLPNPNPSGNFTRITQRLPLRIQIKDSSLPLRPGMLVEVDVDTRNH
jgi:membrane fusion protein (multidrug efflux system)